MLRFFAGLGIGIVLTLVVVLTLSWLVVKKYLKMNFDEWGEWIEVAHECGNNRRYSVIAEYDDFGETRVIKG